MYRFIRHVTVKAAADVPAALQFCTEITNHLNKTYAMGVRTGFQMFGVNRVYWFYDVESLDAVAQLNAKLTQDRAYWEILERAKHLWLEGSMRDQIVRILG